MPTGLPYTTSSLSHTVTYCHTLSHTTSSLSHVAPSLSHTLSPPPHTLPQRRNTHTVSVRLQHMLPWTTFHDLNHGPRVALLAPGPVTNTTVFTVLETYAGQEVERVEVPFKVDKVEGAVAWGCGGRRVGTYIGTYRGRERGKAE